STWPATRWPRWWPDWSWGPRRRGCWTAWPLSAVSGGASSSRVWPGACGSTTTTRTTPRRCRPRCGRPARWRATAGWWWGSSRTAAFATEFATALGLADEVVVLDVYGAREDPQPGVTGQLISDAVPLAPERVHYEPSFTEVPSLVARLVESGDLVLTMGAGDV